MMKRVSVVALLLLVLAAPARAQEPPAAPPPSSPAPSPALPPPSSADPPPAPLVTPLPQVTKPLEVPAVERDLKSANVPSPGTWWIVLGSLGLAAGVGNLALSPICVSSAIKSEAHVPCLGLSFAFGGAFLAAGIPLLVVGAGKRAAWVEWTKRTSLTALPGGAGAAWRTTF